MSSLQRNVRIQLGTLLGSFLCLHAQDARCELRADTLHGHREFRQLAHVRNHDELNGDDHAYEAGSFELEPC